jgi:hypothetical protein
MKLFRCTTPHITFDLIDLPRQSWRILPPRRWQVVLTMAAIVVAAIVWGVL